MKKATFTEKLGYGIASLGDAISYGFVGTFFMFFLTTIVNIPPAIAGTLIAVGSIWNAVINPIIGYLADRVRTRFGRRRPLIFFFSIFIALTLFLMFTNIDMPDIVKPVYYGIMLMLFWVSFTGFFIPYFALGVDYASDYDERTSIRSFASFFNMVGNLFCMVMPTVIVEFLEIHGLTPSQAWSATGGFLSVISFISILVTVIASKKRDFPCEKAPKPEKKQRNGRIIITIFREYIDIARIRPMKYLIVASLMSLITYTMVMSDMLYFFTYNLHLTSVQISICLFGRSFLGIVFIPIVGKLSAFSDKRMALILCYIAGIIGMIAIKFAGIQGFTGALVYIIFVTLCTAIYWQIMPAIFYDICDYDTVTSGKKREATILSFQGLAEAFAVGIGGQILGLILQIAGFDGEGAVQADVTLQWIENSATVLPMISLAAAAFALYKYPLRRKDSSVPFS